MLQVNHLVRASITLGYLYKSALERKDPRMLKMAFEEQIRTLKKIEKLVMELNTGKKK